MVHKETTNTLFHNTFKIKIKKKVNSRQSPNLVCAKNWEKRPQ